MIIITEHTVFRLIKMFTKIVQLKYVFQVVRWTFPAFQYW